MINNVAHTGGRGSCLLHGPPGFKLCFSVAPELVSYLAPRDLHRRAAYSICESCFFMSWCLIFFAVGALCMFSFFS